MNGELVEPDWPPLTEQEVTAVLAGYGFTTGARVRWRSPRPMSAAALVEVGRDVLFVKRHDLRVRSACDLSLEHALAAHLRSGDIELPEVLACPGGSTVFESGRWVYEVHAAIGGVDLYRDAMSWTPYRSYGHAVAAGGALARLHRAAAGFGRAARPLGVLTDSCEVVASARPWKALERVARRPGLAAFLSARPWRQELEAALGPWLVPAAAAARAEPPLWTHGDWHPSNLAWSGIGEDAAVAAVFDLGLANRTFALHDLAVAVERAGIDWLAGGSGQIVDWAGVEGLLDGYRAARPFPPGSGRVLAAVLPVAHVEYALSEIEYFADVVRSPADAELAYDGYLLGHARWFGTREGCELIGWLKHLA